LTVAAGKLSHGFSAVVIAQRSDDGPTKSNTSKNVRLTPTIGTLSPKFFPPNGMSSESQEHSHSNRTTATRGIIEGGSRDAQRLFQRAKIEYLTIRLWCTLTTPEVFSAWQAKFASIHK
jgi:hypothetical protein